MTPFNDAPSPITMPIVFTPPPSPRLLEVGIDPNRREVVINFDKDVVSNPCSGVGHVTFTPDQARNLARVLVAKAQEIERDFPPSVMIIFPQKPDPPDGDRAA